MASGTDNKSGFSQKEMDNLTSATGLTQEAVQDVYGSYFQ